MRYNRLIVLLAELVISASSIAQSFTDNGDGTWTLSSMPAYDINLDVAYQPTIVFADANVKAICVANWDTNNDGELSEAEAAAVTNLGTVFKNIKNITSFNELSYFTGLTSIEENAFHGCSGLTSITIPNNVTSIGDFAFTSCSGLISVTIPNSVTTIGINAFLGCSSLQKVIVSDIAAWYNVIFENGGSNPLYFAHHLYTDESTEITDLVIPNGVTSIGNYSFCGCWGVASVSIPNSVTSIGKAAFDGCTLTSVNVPNSVTSIGKGAFSYSALQKVIVSDIAAWCNITFKDPLSSSYPIHLYSDEITEITDLVIPDGVTSIGKYVFYMCRGLTSVSIPNSVTSIGMGAFEECRVLTSVNIPNSVTSIGNYAFEGCI